MGWVGYPLIASMSGVLFKDIFYSPFLKKSFDPLEIMTIVHWPTSSSPLEVARQRFGFACRSSHRCPHRGLWRTHLEKVWLGCFLSCRQFEDPFGGESQANAMRVLKLTGTSSTPRKIFKESYDTNRDLWHPQKAIVRAGIWRHVHIPVTMFNSI